MSAKVTLITNFILIVCDVTLFLLLMYNESFIYRNSLSISKGINVLMKFLLPVGVIAIIVTYLYGANMSGKKTAHDNCYEYDHFCLQVGGSLLSAIRNVILFVVLFLAFLAILLISGLTITSIYRENLDNTKTQNETNDKMEIVVDGRENAYSEFYSTYCKIDFATNTEGDE